MSFGPLTGSELLGLFGHFMVLSLLAIGGAFGAASDMQRYLVLERGWITDTGFTASIALAQAAPGPNILFVAVLGWNVAGLVGALTTMVGVMLPSTMVSLWASRWRMRHRETLGVRAFTVGMAPMTIGLLLATGWILTEPTRSHVGALLLIAATIALSLRTRLSPMWMVAGGAVVGALGWA
jgi:chromate transporter